LDFSPTCGPDQQPRPLDFENCPPGEFDEVTETDDEGEVTGSDDERENENENGNGNGNGNGNESESEN